MRKRSWQVSEEIGWCDSQFVAGPITLPVP